MLTTPYTTEFHEGLAPARVGDKWGYINTAGEFVIEPQFDTQIEEIEFGAKNESPGGEYFYNGYAVAYKDGQYNIIDKQGAFVLNKSYDSAQFNESYYIFQSEDGSMKVFTRDLAPVISGEGGSMLDENGNVVLQYDDTIREYYGYYDEYDDLFLYKLNGKTGIFTIKQKTQKDDAVSVYCDGDLIEFDQPPIIESDRVLVPMRAIFESLGAQVSWDADTQTIIALKDDTTMVLQIDSNILTKNNENIVLDVPPRLVNGRTLVPVRAVAEGLNALVEWSEETRTVTVSTI